MELGYKILELLYPTSVDQRRLSPLPPCPSDELCRLQWCQHSQRELFKRRTTIRSIRPHRIYRCKTCGVGFRDHFPKPESIKKFYDRADYYFQGIFRSFDEKGNALIEERNSTFRDYLTAVGFENHKFPGKRYLEMGCGVGFALAEMKQRGWEPYGIDVSSWAVRYAKEKLGIENVFVSDNLETRGFPSDFFDFIYLGHVIEHLIDPFSTLKEVSRIIRPQGLLLIITPDMDRDIYNNYIKDHLWLFSAYSMKYWLQVVGFRDVKVWQDGVDLHVTEQPYLITTGSMILAT
jgi:2-polyprenyl-3-methyl-5-hydroxy-6-metoxy-1,4-benzoquinol methylase